MSAEWVRVTILIVCCGVYGRAAGLLIDFVTPYLMEAFGKEAVKQRGLGIDYHNLYVSIKVA